MAKVLHVSVAVLAPYCWFGIELEVIALCYLVASMATSFLFVIVNVGTHLNIHTEMVCPDESDGIPHDWATHQALTTVDWSPQSMIAIALTGGANAHLAHHLFPFAAHCHNAGLAALAGDAAAAHGLKLNVISFKEMLLGHFALLLKYSRRPTR